jgi:CheY-like chemotaxis protein/anti-sigma regulatory factor (Ser/Thr protein kinase)
MPTILVVDDEDLDRELARRCLEPLRNLTVEFAHDGKEALDRISNQTPDLVLTDLRMPGMNGLELVETLRTRHSSLPVLLMTAQGNEKVAVSALRAGAAGYVPKSDLQTDLVEAVEKVLDILESARTRKQVLDFLGHCETRFELSNDTALAYPLVGFFMEGLERIGFGDDYIRTQIGVALMEALTNAIIHGNLEVSSGLRRDHREEFDRLLERRRQEEPYCNRRVHLTARESRRQVEYVIEDQGPGFNPTESPDPTTPENMEGVTGRGLMLIRTFMDTVEFNNTGNRITMKKAQTAAD